MADPFHSSSENIAFSENLRYNDKKHPGGFYMEYRVLGKTGLKISRLGFGGIPIQRIDAEGTKVLMH